MLEGQGQSSFPLIGYIIIFKFILRYILILSQGTLDSKNYSNSQSLFLSAELCVAEL